jgi:hypothetical protein
MTMIQDYEFTQTEVAQFFGFLEGLRISGITNMVGATIYLEEAFEMDSPVAKQILIAWMNTFRPGASLNERVARLNNPLYP